MNHARSLVRRVCDIAGRGAWIDDLRHEAIDGGLVAAVETHDTPVIFDWLMRALSHQGISDAVADGYMDRHGNVTWADIEGYRPSQLETLTGSIASLKFVDLPTAGETVLPDT